MRASERKKTPSLNPAYVRALSVPEMAASSRIGEDAAAALFGPTGARVVAAAVMLSASRHGDRDARRTGSREAAAELTRRSPQKSKRPGV